MANAQGTDYTKKVGVNTDKPLETLEVNGTFKVNTLPKNAEGKSYNGNAALTKNFTATKTVVADANGVIGYVDGLPSTSDNTPTVTGGKISAGVKCFRAMNGRKDFSGYPTNVAVDSSILTVGDYSFGIFLVDKNNLGARFYARKNTDGQEFRIVKALSQNLIYPRYTEYVSYLKGAWNQVTNPAMSGIAWDAEAHSEFLFFGDVDDNTNASSKYNIKIWSQKRTGSSRPEICYYVQELNGN